MIAAHRRPAANPATALPAPIAGRPHFVRHSAANGSPASLLAGTGSGGICFSTDPGQQPPIPAALDFSGAAHKPRYSNDMSNDMLVLISVLVGIAALFGWMSARVLR